MDSMTFHLQGVMRDRDATEDFEGPLNLILMLLSKNKIEIKDIKISEILDQYLEQLKKMEEIDLEVASEFVLMASHLVYIKTKTLLEGDKEVEELDLLISSLEQLKARDAYVLVKAVLPKFAEATARGLLLYTGPGEPLRQTQTGEIRVQEVDMLKALYSIFSRSQSLARREERPQLLPKPIVYGVREKSGEIIDILQGRGEITLEELFKKSRSKSELVATFISVLELCSAGSLLVEGGLLRLGPQGAAYEAESNMPETLPDDINED